IAEAMGTPRLFDFLHDNPRVNMESSAFVHDPGTVARLDRFVAINSALEVDLSGQVTAESLGPLQVAGIGGQFDFVLGARHWRGGDPRAALDGARRPGVAHRAALGARRRRDEPALPGGLGRDRAWSRRAARQGRAGTRPGAARGGASPVSGGAGTRAYFFLAASIFSKISASVGKRYVVWLE